MPKLQRWSLEEDTFLLENVNSIPTKKISKILNRTIVSIRHRARKLNIPLSGYTYTYNKDFFKSWSHDMSYILGFILADGNIVKNKNSNKYKLQICINRKDESVLHFIKENLSPDNKIYYYSQKRKNKLNYGASLILCSQEICLDLIKLGIIPRKTGKEKLPPIPDKYFYSFLLGFFDGDGCISIRKKCDSPFLGFFSLSSNLLLDIKKQIGYGNIIDRDNCPMLSISNRLEIIKLAKKMYENTSFFLKRKRDKFDSFRKPSLFYAFGEYKTILEWSKDKRCMVGPTTLIKRIEYSKEINFELFLTNKKLSYQMSKDKIRNYSLLKEKKLNEYQI